MTPVLALMSSVVAWRVAFVVIAIFVAYFVWRVNRESKPAPPGWQVEKGEMSPEWQAWQRKAEAEKAVETKPVEPLGDFLAGKLLPPEPTHPLPPERALPNVKTRKLPHVQKRKGKRKP